MTDPSFEAIYWPRKTAAILAKGEEPLSDGLTESECIKILGERESPTTPP